VVTHHILLARPTAVTSRTVALEAEHPGGVGKTRLAIEVASPFREDPDRFNAELGAFASSL
jgi:predicted ATPase